MNRVTYWLSPCIRQDSGFSVCGNYRLTNEQWCECEVARLSRLGVKAHIEKDERGRVAVFHDGVPPVPMAEGERDVPDSEK